MNSVVDKIRRIIAITLAFVMLTFGGAFTSLLSYDAYAAEVSVSSWAELKEIVDSATTDTTIVITKDIVATEPINIDTSNKITIKGGTNGATIWRKAGDANFPVFTTSDANAELTLGEKLTLTGQVPKGDCPPAAGFTVTYSNGADSEKTGTKTVNAGDEVVVYHPTGQEALEWIPESGYEFVGWKFKTSADGDPQSTRGTTPPYAYTGFTVPNGITGEMKMVAEYERTNMIVTWSNGVSGDGEKTEAWDLYGADGATKKSVGDDLIKIPDDDWKPGDGYVFKGWKYILSEGGSAVTSSSDGKVMDGSTQVKMAKKATNMTIVAQWEKPASGGSGGTGYLASTSGKICVDRNSALIKLFNIDSDQDYADILQVVEIESSGRIKAKSSNYPNGGYIVMSGPGTPKLVERPQDNASFVIAETDSDGNIKLKSAWPPGYLNSFSSTWTINDTPMLFTLSGASGGGGSATPYTSQVDPEYDDHDPEVYSTTVQPTYTDSNVPQGCDGNCTTYKESDFSSGTTDAPNGFFVQVEAGKVTLDGATLENFNTSTNKDETPKDVAPVVASGSTAKFFVKSGKIQNNIVGYTANDEQSTDGANAIKKYIKGAAPNARRKNAPEPADGTRRRRNSPAGIDGGDAGTGITGTAGAIIYAKGAQGEIFGGSIGYNRADTGGVMVTDENTFVEIKPGADINNNVGVQFGGGVMVEQGGAVYMSGGEIHDNVAWFGGGAVFATENGIDWLRGEKSMSKDDRIDGYFTMAGGKIYGNNAFTRGGGFLVDSNGVSLEAGEIYENTSRVLGGGAYVMGDHPDYSYTLYIAKGNIYDNEAVTANQNEPTPSISTTPMSKKLNSVENCEMPTSLFGSSMSGTSDDIDDFQRINDGTGGGVWTCSYGSTVLDLDVSKVCIDKNRADGATGDPSRYSKTNKRLENANEKNKVGGQDFHSDNGGDGTLLMIGADSTEWLDENTDAIYAPGEIDAEIRNLTYEGTYSDNGGIQIYNNTSRRGGGLAADGTFVFGPNNDVARLTADLEVSKVWEDGVEKKPVVIRVGVKSGDKEAIIEDLELDGSANSTDEESSHENESTDTEWSGGFNLPVSVDDEEGNRITVFKLIGPDDTPYDPTNNDDMLALAAALKNSDGTGFKLSSDAKLTFTELVKVGENDYGENEYEETKEYNFDPGEVEISDLSITVNPVKRVNAQGEIVDVLEVSFTKVPLRAPLRNNAPEKPEIEKYVNQAVHDYINLDDVFTYDVLAYVTKNADKFTITDKVVEDLEIVSSKEDIVVLDLGPEINHEVVNDINGKKVDTDDNASVALEEGDEYTYGDSETFKVADISSQAKDITIETIENKDILTVVFDDEVDPDNGNRVSENVKNLRGHWVKVTFKAQIKQTLQDEINAGTKKLSDLKSVTVKGDEAYKADPSIFDDDRPEPNVGNDPVVSNETHKGIDNTASYTIETFNDGEYKDESNTVTVKPEKPEVEKYVNQAVHKNIALDEVFTYDVIGFITRDADKIVIEDTLVSCLEFVNVDGIKVETIAENNHKPTNDIAGQQINDDASVAEAGDNIKNQPGVTVEVVDNKLTVTIDDDVTVDQETGEIIRNNETVLKNRGKYVKITFQAQIKEEIQEKIKSGEVTIEDLLANENYAASVAKDKNAPVESDEAHAGIKNDAKMKITVGNEDKYNLESNKVTVKPEQPEIEKYVNQAVHDFVKLDEVFTYDIIAYVTKDADKVVITDELDDQLQFESKEDEIKVVDLGKENNHKVTNDINAKQVNKDASVAEKGEPIENKTVTIAGNKLTVTLVDENADDNTVRNLRGHWIKVTFDAKIKDGLSTADLKYTKIDAAAKEDRDGPNVGNDPVKSNESHDGVPNKASYKIGVMNEPGKYEDKHEDESNTVTVKPEEFDVKISKTDLGGDELSGAKIEVKDKDGKVVDRWTSKDKPHELKLKPGEYTMVEVVAPKGFGRVTTEIKFTVDKDGKVKLGTTKVDNNGEIKLAEGEDNHLLLQDAPVLKITKTDLGGDELPGAKIEIRDENDKVVDTWTSDKKPHELTLKPGKYFLVEVNAPEGFNAVTTKIEFTIDAKGKVTLGTTTVNNGGKILVAEGEDNHLILQDAPKPTLSKTVNGGSEVDLTNPDEVFSYTITSKIAYVPDESFAIIDEVPQMLEIVDSEDIVITVNNEYLLSDDVAMILSIEGNTLTVAPTKEMMEEWGPFEIAVKFFCKVREGENIDGKSVKNVAMLEVDGEFIDNGDGEDEATVRGVYTDYVDVKGKEKETTTKGAKTGDKTEVLFWITLLALSAATGTAAVIRRRRSVR